jgi:hypothetical protein
LQRSEGLSFLWRHMTQPQLRSCLNRGTTPLSLVTASQIPSLQSLNVSRGGKLRNLKLRINPPLFIGIRATFHACEINHDSSGFWRTRDSLPCQGLVPNQTDTQLDCARRIILKLHITSHSSLQHNASVQPVTESLTFNVTGRWSRKAQSHRSLNHSASGPPLTETQNLSPTVGWSQSLSPARSLSHKTSVLPVTESQNLSLTD